MPVKTNHSNRGNEHAEFLSELGITSWDINNFQQVINKYKYNKLHNPQTLNILTRSLVFGLIETHHTSEDIGKLHIEHYRCHSVCRPKSKNVKRHKPSGGIAVYVHNSIAPGVSFMNEAGSESIFVQLKKEYFNFRCDVYLCFAYLVPSSSKVLGRGYMPDDIFDDLSSKLAKYSDRGDLILLDDLNARTQNLQDFISDSDADESGISNSLRNSVDQALPNSYGRKLIDICHETPLRILNGRFLGDFMGNFTCVRPQGASVVDYAVASPDILQNVVNFCVHHPVPALSDHCLISVIIKVMARCSVKEQEYTFLPKPAKVTWVKGMTDVYSNVMQSHEVRRMLGSFISVGILPDQLSIDSATSLLTKTMVTAARQAGMQVREGAVPRRQARQELGFSKPRMKHPRRYGISCHEAHSAVRKTAELLKDNPRNAWLRGKLCSETKVYKRVMKSSQKKFTDGLYADLESMDRADPKGYMDLVKSLKEGNFDKKMPSDISGVTRDLWFYHF